MLGVTRGQLRRGAIVFEGEVGAGGLQRLDADRDGALSFEEFSDTSAIRFVATLYRAEARRVEELRIRDGAIAASTLGFFTAVSTSTASA